MTDDPTEREASIRRRLVAVQNGRMYQADHQRSAPGDIEWLLARLDAERAALADVRQRCGGYPDSRVDGDGGIVAVVVRERDEARETAEIHRTDAVRLHAEREQYRRERDEARETAEIHRTDAVRLHAEREQYRRERDEARDHLTSIERR